MFNGSPVPLSLLRGHLYPVTCLKFHHDASLVSGDDNGWIYWWSLVTRRPLAIWRAHKEPVVSVVWVDDTHLLTQGRDDKLYIWRLELDANGQTGLATKPPQPGFEADFPAPWKTYSLTINSLNFCPIAWSNGLLAKPGLENSEKVELLRWTDGTFRMLWNDVYPRVTGSSKTGIVMDLHLTESSKLIVGYESGAVAVFDISDRKRFTPELNYYVVCHVQPVLSVRAHPLKREFLSTSADSLIVKHPIGDEVIPEVEEEEPSEQFSGPKIVGIEDSPELEPPKNITRGFDVPNLDLNEKLELQESVPLDAVNIRHSGLSCLQLDSKGDLIMTAGWDGRVRLFSYDNISPISVFHERDGAGCVAFSTPATNVTGVDPRRARALSARWIAVGGKDGKIALYMIEENTKLGKLVNSVGSIGC